MDPSDGTIVRTHVGIYERHREWADAENKNLSAVVRDLLDEEMREERGRGGSSGWDS